MAINKKVVTISTLGALFVATGTLYHASKMMSDTFMKRKNNEDNSSNEPNGVNVLQIRNRDGETLNGYYFDNEASTTMIILHPYGLKAIDMVVYVDFFRNIYHCNFLLVDVYGHGKSDGDIYRLGGKDQADLIDWVTYLDQHFDGNIILFGKEMGANIILNATNELNQFDQIKLILSEGAYTNVKDILSYRLEHDYYITRFPFVMLMRRIIKRKYGIDINTLNSVEAVKNSQIPILFIHTKQDRRVPLKQVFPLYNKARCKKELFILKDEKELYELDETKQLEYTQLKTFINECLK